MIDGLNGIFHSRIKSLEILYVLEGVKPCARILVSEDFIAKIENFLKNKKLNFSVSDFKLLKESCGFYSDKSMKIQKNDSRKGYLIVYVSKDKSCLSAKSLEKRTEHFLLGLTLGYPKCCCSFFEKNFSAANTDLTLDALFDSKGFEFLFPMNICARHFDVSLLSHFPCSFSCKESLDIARKNFEIIKKRSHFGNEFENTLKSVSVYTKDKGIFLLPVTGRKGGEFCYEHVLGTQKNKLYYFLSSSNKIRIFEKNEFEIDCEKIHEPVMAFS